MASENFMFNVGKGRFAELINRIKNNEPANAALILVPVKVSDTKANRQDDANLEAVLASVIDEQTEGWSRKVLDDTVLAAIAADNTNDRMPVSIPAVKWTAPTAAKNTTGILVCVDMDTTGGTDANLIPVGHLAFEITADGSDVEVNAGEIFRAT
jgi:hypothetical protein